MTRMTATVLTEFLLARIAEDEYAFRWLSTDGPPGVFIQNVKVDGRRLLAECEAKRRIVEDEPLRLAGDRHSQWERTLRTLAAIYADHPDYRDEWKP